jgi:hypothetical protein
MAEAVLQLERSQSASTHAPCTVEVARTTEQVEAVRGPWERFQAHPNVDIDFFLTVLGLRDEVLRPQVFLCRRNERIEAMFIGRVEEHHFPVKLGYRTLFKQRVRMLVVVHGGLLGDVSDENSKAVVAEIRRMLRRREVDVAMFSHIPQESPLYKAALNQPGILCRDYSPSSGRHWAASLPETADQFFSRLKSKHRYWIRRVEKHLDRDYPNRVTHRCFRDIDEIEQLCNDVETVASKTYQRGLGAGFIADDEHRQRLLFAATKGWLCAFVTYVADQPCAFWIGTHDRDTFHIDFTGFDPAFRKYEPGTILFRIMIQELCSRGVERVDFGLGDAPYKQRYGDTSWIESSVLVFAPSWKGLRLAIARFAADRVSRLGRLLLKTLKIHERSKRRWRDRLTPASRRRPTPSRRLPADLEAS